MRIDHAVLNEDGEVIPCDLISWASFLRGPQRIIAQDNLFGYLVSTVFLGLNHQYESNKPPLWFETMVFDRWKGEHSSVDGRPLTHCDLYIDRYTTLKEAVWGHQGAIAWLEEQPFFYQLALPWTPPLILG